PLLEKLSEWWGGGADSGEVAESQPFAAVEDSAGALADSSSGDYYRVTGASGEGYSATNAQVEGIDEPDIVKTDGESLFIARDRAVSIVAARGAATAETATLSIDADLRAWAEREGAPEGAAAYMGIADLVVSAGVLAVIATPGAGAPSMSYSPEELDQYKQDSTEWDSRTVLLTYDVSNPASPSLISALSQSGAYTTARLMDGAVYMVSSYSLPGGLTPVEDEPATYVPQVGDADGCWPVAPQDIAIMPEPSSPTYAVITATNLERGERLSDLSVLGGAETVYMSKNNLYLAAVNWSGGGSATDIARVALGSGELTIAAQGSLDGQLLNQFSLDEYEGHLRAVTTAAASGEWDEMAPVFSEARLTVLNGDLKAVGGIDALAQNEDVRAVRFMGATGYVVTFEQTDPLFAVDLSDPKAPRVLSKLEIPGFSSYLHPWGDGQLLGLGYAGDTSGLTGGLKLSMFDVSAADDVAEVAAKGIDVYDAEALRNHHAIWADPALGLVGFYAGDGPGNASYLVYRYGDGGFQEAAALAVMGAPEVGWWYEGVRGVRVGTNLYVCSQGGVAVYALDGFEPVAELHF
ncbi:MAG: beta-propeller domain-containing protein, partial [Bifidobacteriaceae bacterium]|nr:beta-propeller domain-containing protein [Bifidobacteriaceae bacterium]